MTPEARIELRVAFLILAMIGGVLVEVPTELARASAWRGWSLEGACYAMNLGRGLLDRRSYALNRG